MHAMTLATTCSHAWSAQCVIIVAPMSARHGYITADWSHPFADPDAAARQPSPAPKRRRLGRHSFRPATARSELAGNLETDRRGPVAITDVGEAQSIPIELQSSLLDFVVANLPGPEGRILKAIAAHYPNAVPNEPGRGRSSA